ncbi:MAG: GNAT family N-acetyltransferase [Alphaproteobacteria bacterium]|nr:GNAT family N-acetyltransferase [Alphaproteobacteria bacterium]
MAFTEPLTPITLTPRHISGAMALVTEAGWNQVDADWAMMLETGTGFGFQTADDRLVASAVILPYGPRLGWISMVLVAGDWQRRGFATRLLNTAIAGLEDTGRTPALDATPDGEKVYARLGFTPRFGFSRWQRGAKDQPSTELPTTVEAVDEAHMDEIIACDRGVFGAERAGILTNLAARGGPAYRAPQKGGFGLSRAGRIAHQIGPINAENTHRAMDLFHALLAEISGPTIVDVPEGQIGFLEGVKSAGFTRQRPLLRMVRGGAEFGDTARMFALAGPELG